MQGLIGIAAAVLLLAPAVPAATASQPLTASPSPSPSTTPTPTPTPAPTPAPAAVAPADNRMHLYVLDGYGGLHPATTSSALPFRDYWPGTDIARSLATFPDGSGGLVLDALGGLHPFGSALAAGAGAPTGSPYWGWDIARGVVLAPWSSAATPAGWVLDGWGGVHEFGTAPALTIPGAYWPGRDIARALAVTPDSSPTSVSGYLLDGLGGLHPITGPGAGAPAGTGTPYFGWDIARGLAMAPNSTAASPSGWVLDGWGGLHPFGAAASQPYGPSAYWQNWDIARAIVAWTGSGSGAPGGWVLDAFGGLHAFGSAGALGVTEGAYWPNWNIARGVSGCGSGSGAPAPPPPPPPKPKHKIVVSLSQQHLWAYNDDGGLFLETDVTTGRPELPTPPGDYHIFARYSPYQMISPWPYGSPFWYPSAWVQYAMEFLEGGYFLHDAPWRSWFGPGSQYGDGTHGCINIPGGLGWGPIYALWNWAQIGDEVLVQN